MHLLCRGWTSLLLPTLTQDPQSLTLFKYVTTRGATGLGSAAGSSATNTAQMRGCGAAEAAAHFCQLAFLDEHGADVERDSRFEQTQSRMCHSAQALKIFQKFLSPLQASDLFELPRMTAENLLPYKPTSFRNKLERVCLP